VQAGFPDSIKTTMAFSKLRVWTKFPPLNQILILQTWTRAHVFKTHSNCYTTKVLILAQAENMHIIDSKPTQSNVCKKKVLSDNIAQGASHCIAYNQIQNPYRFLQDKVIDLEES